MSLAGCFSTFNWGYKRHLSQYKGINQQVGGPSARWSPAWEEQREVAGEGSGGRGGHRCSRQPRTPPLCGLWRSHPHHMQLRTWTARSLAAPSTASQTEPLDSTRQVLRNGPGAVTEASAVSSPQPKPRLTVWAPLGMGPGRGSPRARSHTRATKQPACHKTSCFSAK